MWNTSASHGAKSLKKSSFWTAHPPLVFHLFALRFGTPFPIRLGGEMLLTAVQGHTWLTPGGAGRVAVISRGIPVLGIGTPIGRGSVFRPGVPRPPYIPLPVGPI